MYQGYEIILWKKAEPEERDFDSIVKQAYQTFELFLPLKTNYRPNYQTVNRKKDAKKFDWNYENFVEEVKKGADEFSDSIGYGISFFSSLKNRESIGFLSTFGAKSKRVTNVFIVNFKDLIDLQDKEEVLKMEVLFKQAIQVFQPYWGGVLSSLSSDKLREMNIQCYDNLVHWMNYYDENFVQEIGEERIRDFLQEFPSASYEVGRICKDKYSACRTGRN